jgi:replicative DNA helicase
MPVAVTLSQSKEQQQALFGYVVRDPAVYEAVEATMRNVGSFGWLNPHHTRLWAAIARFREENDGRHPTPAELRNTAEVLDNDAKMQERLADELAKAQKATAEFEYAPLARQLRDWQKAIVLDKDVKEMARKYNQGDLPAAIKVIDALATKLESIDDLVTTCRFDDSTTRLAGDVEFRKLYGAQVLKYGVPFLDEATGGIPRRSLIVIGARTGAGKTQLVTRIAMKNAQDGKRVSILALEAEEGEIERRMKFSFTSTLAQHAGINIENWTFQDWMLYKLPEATPFEAAAEERCAVALKGVRTLYRNYGDFGIAELEKQIIKAAKFSDLIILDHLHYVDTDGDDDNSDYKRIVRLLRNLTLNFGVPIIVVAHLRKKQGGKSAPVIPELDDFHGTSEITKHATEVIVLSRVREIEYGGAKPQGLPTYMRLVKHRLDGARSWPAAITFYQPAFGYYAPEYGIGQMYDNDQKWKPFASRPIWATHGDVRINAAS